MSRGERLVAGRHDADMEEVGVALVVPELAHAGGGVIERSVAAAQVLDALEARSASRDRDRRDGENARAADRVADETRGVGRDRAELTDAGAGAARRRATGAGGRSADANGIGHAHAGADRAHVRYP